MSHRPVLVLLCPTAVTIKPSGHRVAKASEASGVWIVWEEGVDRIFLKALRCISLQVRTKETPGGRRGGEGREEEEKKR